MDDWRMMQNPFSLHFIVPLENQTRAPEFILALILLFVARFFLYSNGNNPVLLRNNSANRLEVEYPTVWATCPTVSSVYASRYSACSCAAAEYTL